VPEQATSDVQVARCGLSPAGCGWYGGGDGVVSVCGAQLIELSEERLKLVRNRKTCAVAAASEKLARLQDMHTLDT
jgi:hypothetical protein